MRTEKKQAYLSNENISVPLFKNKWLDSLTRTHIAIPVSMFFLYAIALLYYTKVATDLTTLQVTSLYITGFLFFTFAEYMVHRHVYHLPGTTEKRAKFAYTMHGIHHDYPKDKQRLAMPPAMSVAVGTILFFLFELILDKFSFSFLAGFLSGYAFYLLVHYSIHIFLPPNNMFKALWVNHALHHYGKSDTMFGVSSPLWDYIFGTTHAKLKGSIPTDLAHDH